MCYRTQLIGTVLFAFGLGLLLSCLFQSLFWTILLGIGALISSLFLFKCH